MILGASHTLVEAANHRRESTVIDGPAPSKPLETGRTDRLDSPAMCATRTGEELMRRNAKKRKDEKSEASSLPGKYEWRREGCPEMRNKMLEPRLFHLQHASMTLSESNSVFP